MSRSKVKRSEITDMHKALREKTSKGKPHTQMGDRHCLKYNLYSLFSLYYSIIMEITVNNLANMTLSGCCKILYYFNYDIIK